MAINRREFLRYSTAGAALGVSGAFMHDPLLHRSVQAALMGTSSKKMLVIFMRGGIDAANTIIPGGDSDYSDVTRPSLFIPEEESVDLGNGFARAHPALDRVVSDVPDTDVCYLHRLAYESQSRSHFSSQHYWETAAPGDTSLEVGFINRLVDHSTDLSELALPATSISANLQLLFRGPFSLAHIQELSEYVLGDTPRETKLLGSEPALGDPGSGLLGVFSRDSDGARYDEQLRADGLTLATSMQEISSVDIEDYVPEGDATYPSADDPGDFTNPQAFRFFQQLRDSVILLKETDCRIAGIELSGFDTHSNQAMQLSSLLEIISHGIYATYEDTSPGGLWEDLIVVTLTEFGRTSAENGSLGTDHGEAGCMIVAGGGVNGGVYNCDGDTWADGDLFSTPAGAPRYLSHLTDYRAVLAEIVDRHFDEGDSLDDVIPGWDALTGDEFAYLDFLS